MRETKAPLIKVQIHGHVIDDKGHPISSVPFSYRQRVEARQREFPLKQAQVSNDGSFSIDTILKIWKEEWHSQIPGLNGDVGVTSISTLDTAEQNIGLCFGDPILNSEDLRQFISKLITSGSAPFPTCFDLKLTYQNGDLDIQASRNPIDLKELSLSTVFARYENQGVLQPTQATQLKAALTQALSQSAVSSAIPASAGAICNALENPEQCRKRLRLSSISSASYRSRDNNDESIDLENIHLSVIGVPNDAGKTLKNSSGNYSVFNTPDGAVLIRFPKVGPVTNSVNRLNISNDDGTNIHELPPVTQYTWQTVSEGGSLYILTEIKNISSPPRLSVNQPKFLIYGLLFFQEPWKNMGPINVKWSVKTTGGHEVETLEGKSKDGSPLRCNLSSLATSSYSMTVIAACVQSGSDHPSVESQKLFLDSMTF